MAESPADRSRSNRWQIIGIYLGILTTFALIAEVDGIWRYIYLLGGGAIGALLGRIAAKLCAARKP